MKYETTGKLGLGLGAALLLVSGCVAPESASEGMGTARVRIEAARTDDFEITRVTVTAQGGFEAELVRDAAGGFVGTLLLPAGPNELVGAAFAGAELVGVSAPVPVEIQAGLVTGATIRILDVTGGEDIGHRPIILSLTHPLSAIANQPVELAVSFVEPDFQGVAITWSTDCADAALSSPDLPSTTFTKASPGLCNVSVTVSDGELSASDSFSIVVFDQDQGQGAVDIDGEFVSAPQLVLEILLENQLCSVSSDSVDGTCTGSIAAPDRAHVRGFVNWGNAIPGTVDVVDNGCGGSLQFLFNDPFFFEGEYTPPSFETVCAISARASSDEGLFSQLSAVFVVRAGDPGPPPNPPMILFTMVHPSGVCDALPGQTDVSCSPVLAGNSVDFFGQVDWGQLAPGDVFVEDTCGGEVVSLSGDGLTFQGVWAAPLVEADCALILNAVSFEGVAAATIMRFPVVTEPSPPPADIRADVLLQQIDGDCSLSFGASAVDCPPIRAGGNALLQAQIHWGSLAPGQIDVHDDCGGSFAVQASDPLFLEAVWFPESFIGAICTIHVDATAADGQGRSFELVVPVI